MTRVSGREPLTPRRMFAVAATAPVVLVIGVAVLRGPGYAAFAALVFGPATALLLGRPAWLAERWPGVADQAPNIALLLVCVVAFTDDGTTVAYGLLILASMLVATRAVAFVLRRSQEGRIPSRRVPADE